MTTKADLSERQQRERDFYEEYATLHGIPEVDFGPVMGKERRPWNSYWYVYDVAREHYESGARELLDFGCGNGEAAMRFAHIGYRVTGFDISPGNIGIAEELARRYGFEDRTEFSVQQAERLEYPDEQFDVVVGINILHHVEIRPAVAEALRVLKTGGVAIFREHSGVRVIDGLRNTRVVRRWFPKGRSLDCHRHITEDERKLTRSDLAEIREICPQTQARAFKVLSRLDWFLRRPGSRRASALERVDHLLLKAVPGLGRLGDSLVLTLTKEPRRPSAPISAAAVYDQHIPRPCLIVTVDTEEDDWGNATSAPRKTTVRNIDGLGRLQQVCDRFGVPPTYLVDTPVVEDDRAVEVLRRLQDAGRCEIGAHLHPWHAPPFDEKLEVRSSFLCNLCESLQREKLTRLTETIEQRLSRRPTSFRAGRYGLDIVGARILEELGYLVDSSVIPFEDYSFQEGPDFRLFPYKPYRIGREDLGTPHPAGKLLEVPVSVGFSRAGFARARRIRDFAAQAVFRPFRLVGALDRMNLVRRIKFSPEQADAARMRQLVDAYVANRAPSLVMMLHSSSLVPGFSPYVPDLARLDRLYRDLEATLDYCLNRHGMEAKTLTGFAHSFQETDA